MIVYHWKEKSRFVCYKHSIELALEGTEIEGEYVSEDDYYSDYNLVNYSCIVCENAKDSDDNKPMPQEEYLESGGKYCPVCRSTNITVEDPIDHDTHCNRLYCMTCGQYWNELFTVKLKGYTLGDD